MHFFNIFIYFPSLDVSSNPVLITRRIELYQYVIWYTSLCVGDCLVCQSGRNSFLTVYQAVAYTEWYIPDDVIKGEYLVGNTTNSEQMVHSAIETTYFGLYWPSSGFYNYWRWVYVVSIAEYTICSELVVFPTKYSPLITLVWLRRLLIF